MSHGWAKASACHLHVSLSVAVLCHIVSLQCLSKSSLHRLTGLHCRPFSSFGIQVVTREVHRSSLRQWICPVQDHLIFLTLLIISMTFVLSPLVFYHSLCADVGYCHWAVRMYMCFSISMYTYSIHCSYNDVEIA